MKLGTNNLDFKILILILFSLTIGYCSGVINELPKKKILYKNIKVCQIQSSKKQTELRNKFDNIRDWLQISLSQAERVESFAKIKWLNSFRPEDRVNLNIASEATGGIKNALKNLN